MASADSTSWAFVVLSLFRLLMASVRRMAQMVTISQMSWKRPIMIMMTTLVAWLIWGIRGIHIGNRRKVKIIRRNNRFQRT